MSPCQRLPLVALWLIAAVATARLYAAPQAPPERPRTPAPAERLGPNLFRIGTVRVDTAKREVSVGGSITEATTLEFIAVVKGGLKEYESAIALDADAINFNVGLILIGLDPAHATAPTTHLDPKLPKGDPVELWVEWTDGAATRRQRAEQLVFNEQTKTTLSDGPWVYTGSYFSRENNGYLAEIEGTLIGFVHTPSPVIESPRELSKGPYGSNKLNPGLGLKPGQKVTLTVRALTPGN